MSSVVYFENSISLLLEQHLSRDFLRMVCTWAWMHICGHSYSYRRCFLPVCFLYRSLISSVLSSETSNIAHRSVSKDDRASIPILSWPYFTKFHERLNEEEWDFSNIFSVQNLLVQSYRAQYTFVCLVDSTIRPSLLMVVSDSSIFSRMTFPDLHWTSCEPWRQRRYDLTLDQYGLILSYADNYPQMSYVSDLALQTYILENRKVSFVSASASSDATRDADTRQCPSHVADHDPLVCVAHWPLYWIQK